MEKIRKYYKMIIFNFYFSLGVHQEVGKIIEDRIKLAKDRANSKYHDVKNP